MALHIVTGSPGCGKSTWVRHTAKPGDIIIGSDELTNALTGKTESKHHHDKTAKKISAAAREASINEAIKHSNIIDVWILISNLAEKDAQAWRRRGGKIIIIDPGYDTAKQRCKDNRPGYKHRLVDAWYGKRDQWPTGAQIIDPPFIVEEQPDDDVMPTTSGATSIHVVTGPPAAGKSTYIREQWQPGDVIIDFDTIANELAGAEPNNHQHPQHIKLITKATRQAAIDAAIKHAGDHTVWIIHSSPSEKLLDHYKKLGAVIDVIDPGKDVVMKRCKAERPPEMLKVAAVWYSKQKPKTATTTTERGYGWQHQQAREMLLRKHKDGTLCWWCAQPMFKDKAKNFDGRALARDHIEEHGARRGSNKDRLLHFTCNSQRQGGHNDAQRPAAVPAPEYGAKTTSQGAVGENQVGINLSGLAFQ